MVKPISLRIRGTEEKRLKLLSEQRQLRMRFDRAMDRISDARDLLHVLNTAGVSSEGLSELKTELLERIRMAECVRASLLVLLKPINAQLQALNTKQRGLQTIQRLGGK
jgi:hypothetical protein